MTSKSLIALGLRCATLTLLVQPRWSIRICGSHGRAVCYTTPSLATAISSYQFQLCTGLCGFFHIVCKHAFPHIVAVVGLIGSETRAAAIPKNHDQTSSYSSIYLDHQIF
ncbi:hypothetical protein SDJN03_02251, partial [Cucurbita argyrosperma subsp. sororia]